MPKALDKTPKPEVTRSPALSLTARPGRGDIRGRKVALLVADGIDHDTVRSIADALLAAGAVPRVVGSQLGAVQTPSGELEVETTVEATPSVLYDAVVLAGNQDVVSALVADGRVREFVKDQYRHCKPMLVLGEAARLLQMLDIPTTLPEGGPDPGLILARDAADGIATFATALGKHRHFERETDPPRV
jgi:catalase